MTLTNLTGDHILAPAVVVTHSREAMPVFTPGQAASSELEMLAEEGRVDALIALAMSDPGVLDVKTITGAGGAIIMPGESASAAISFDYDHNMVSLVAMLVSTNDGFVGMRSVMIPMRGARTYMANAWDAGTEANTEDCSHVPGPPCGTHDGCMTEGAEGHVHIHPGIRGSEGVPASKDWRNPVAMIRISGIAGDSRSKSRKRR